MGRPKLSLVIPTHGREGLLKEMLQALNAQTLGPEKFEVVVIVDGDTDGTLAMVQGLETRYTLRAYQQQRAGPAGARNRGAELARGEVLVFLDDDMLPDATFLAEHLRMHEEHPHAVVLGPYLPPPMSEVATQGGWNIWQARVLTHHYRQMAEGIRPPAGRRLYSGNFSIPREDFIRVGGFDVGLERGEDVELGFRLEHEGMAYYYSEGACTLHRGFHGFDSWCRSASLYGQCDALFGNEKGYKVAPEVIGWFHEQRPAYRWAIFLCMGRPRLTGLLVHLFKAVSEALTRLRLYGLAHYGYSSIYKLLYWDGYVQEIGGKAMFQKQIVAWRAQGKTDADSPSASWV